MRTMRTNWALFAGVLVALSCASLVASVAVGIDFGSSTYKAVLVQNKFRIVLNEQSGRMTSASVAFRNGERTFSSAADNAARFQPDISFNYLRDLLGKTSPQNLGVQRLLPYILYENRLTESGDDEYPFMALKIDDETSLGVHELVAMILEQCRLMVEKEAGSQVPDAVITVPVYFTQRERQALIEAAEIAGINVLSLINEPTAFALQHATDFAATFTEPKNVLFVDLGESALQLSLFRYDYAVGRDKKNVTQATNLGVAWDTSMGGREFDRSLVDHFAGVLKKQGADIYAKKRALHRLKSQMHKSKEVLSANKETEFVLEGIIDDIDLKGKITREDFEAMNAHHFTKAIAKIEALIVSANLTKEDVHYVELVGGSSRIPKFQELLKAYFNRETLDFHLNGDEGAVFGAAYFAAELSSQHRVKEIRLKDATPWRVSVNVKELAEAEIADDEEPLERQAALFRSGNRYASKKTLSFHTVRDFQMDMYYNISDDETALPIGTETHLGHFEYRGVPTNALYNLTDTPKVHVAFRLSPSGTIEALEQKAEFQVSEMVTRKKKIELGEKIVDKKPEAEDGVAEEDEVAPAKEGGVEVEMENAESNENEARSTKGEESISADATKEEIATDDTERTPSEEAVEEFVTEERVVVKTIPLTMTHSGRHFLPFSLRKSAIKILAEFLERDRIRIQTEVAKNDLEAYIIDHNLRLDDNEFALFSTDAERTAITELLRAGRDWLETDGEDSTLSEYVEQRAKLVAAVAPVQFRLTERTARADASKHCVAKINITRTLIPGLVETHNVTAEEVAELLSQAEEIEKWLTEKLDEQAQLALNIDPLVTSDQITSKCEEVASVARRLIRRPKKPPPKPVAVETEGEEDPAKLTEEPEIYESEEPVDTGANQGPEKINEERAAESEPSIDEAEKPDL